MQNRVGSRLITEQRHDEEVRLYVQQLMKGPSKTRRVRGPTLLKDISNLPLGKAIVVPFNSRNQSIGKEGRKHVSFVGIIARTPDLTPLSANDWRVFDDEEKTKSVDVVKQAKQTMAHTGGSKSITTLMNE
ncbi:hypothetical protein KY285_024158 [Solanum tuberosum]|nr:hypothetical protein KY289_024348 [Solanum tuberosum]KAH0676357.1 hypothetical protein KY285_024158 [Solanum tuberosum]